MQEFTLLELADKMRTGELTCYRIVSNYLDLIRVYDPPLRSVIEINPEAFEIAKSLDAERAAGKIRGPLHGIPILLKENIDTADQMQTTSGSLALEGNIAPRFVVSAGAIFHKINKFLP